MSDPAGLPLTVLDAVNVLLRAVNLREVPATNSTPDSYSAYKQLDRANTTIQAKGWFCNTIATTITRDGANNVLIPSNYLLVRPTRGGNIWPKYAHVRYDAGVRKLWDATPPGTFLWGVNPDIEAVIALDFDDLPPALRWYIVCHAGRFYMPEAFPTPEFYRFSAAVEEDAQASAAHEDEILRDGALYETSPHFRGMRQR